ncbi:hypothetical protein NCAS_0C00220 [Naumovozyma castellii]|uniref:Zn(2)-C6 fungal-type domain-containing protein n=1 Tax=Naumovozyma castellii TaxID=27288 RepID=G0VC05_NAUCA|nr:hypothetical protein NCAS_0C00220 [Naumovozyma castellii CBS 4309]CCC69012.1 hypothetical protein NCAS_0C00220 [Naumovozyma castellii CBS 4309]
MRKSAKTQTKRPRRAKTFTGCWTCRSRKVKCDLRRPGCVRCDKSGLECGGYDIKLRWSKLVKFDPYGVQLPPSPNGNSASNEEPQYQRRNIDFVKYKEEYIFHEDMDDELSILHAPPTEKIADGKTWIIKKFGVFRGTDKIDKQYAPRKKRRKPAPSTVSKRKTLKTGNKLSAKESAGKPINIEDSPSKPMSNHQSPVNNIPSFVDFDLAMNNVPSYEWISSELRDDVLLSAFAIQGASINDVPDSTTSAKTSINQGTVSTGLFSNIPIDGTNSIGDDTQTSPNNDYTIQNALNLLFHNKQTPTSPSTSKGMVKTLLDAPQSDSHMPRTIMEIINPSPLELEIFEALNKLNLSWNIPASGVNVHGIGKFLLNYYLENVADLMTVVPLSRNPWKKLYFPRALQALGDLVGLGYTTNSRNSLLNALLAVSCFNLKSKFEKNSKEYNYFLNLGIELRKQASNFLNICLNSTVTVEKYKDVLTAILSMNSIDVVWGTMEDCQRHLTICEDFVEKRMNSRPHISGKARTLHRIFSFLKLIQDSTALDKVRDKEIVIYGKKDKPDKNKVADPFVKDTSNNGGQFRESLNKLNGKIQIEYIRNDDSNDNNEQSASSSPPMFANIASESYYKPGQKSESDYDILSTDALYGLPNSLILLFSDCVRIVRHNEYYNIKYLAVPREFTEICLNFEKRLLKWKPEWAFYKENTDEFIDDTIEGVYHHTMSFYYGLVIYYFSMAKHLNNQFLQSYVEKVLLHLNKLTDLIDHKSVKIVPLMWQGFIAGCSSNMQDLQQEFRKWAAKLAESGMGSYWGARQVMFEVWRRRMNDEPNDNWYSVYKDWQMNLMLS